MRVFNNIPLAYCISIVRKWQKNKYKNGINSFSNDDPFINETNMQKKFTVSLLRAIVIINYFIFKGDKYSPYVQHFY